MTRPLALLAAVVSLCLAGLALADSGPTVAPQGNSITATVSADGGRLTWYVDTLGSNANTCTAPYTDGGRVGPCLTTQGAISKLPKFHRHQIEVRHAALVDGGPAGYPCFYYSGFAQDLGYTLDAGIHFTGPLVNFLPDGGLLSGTGTISAVGTDGTQRNWSTVTDGTQTWADDSLTGYMIEITGGTGAGSVVQIDSNDAGTLKVVGTWTLNGQTTPTAGSTYAIRRPGWVITSACTAPGAPLSAPVANQAGIYLVGNLAEIVSGMVTVSNVGFEYPSGGGIVTGGNTSLRLRNYRMVLGNGGGVSTLLNSNPRLTIERGSFTGNAGAYAVTPLGSAQVSVIGVISYGANAGVMRLTNGNSGLAVLTMSNSRSRNASVGGVVLHNCAPGTNMQQSWFGCASDAGFGVMVGHTTAVTFNSVGSQSFGSGVCVAALLNDSVDSSCGVGLGVSGPLAVGISNNVDGSPPTGYEANWGGRIQVVTGSPLRFTGSVQDVSLDHGAFVGAYADFATNTCSLADGGVSSYGSRFCK